ncbi:hypothetical protein ACH82I_04790 [Brevibacterium sp. GP-SGM9]|uniref:hypothetical protein n=1 Tax=unclassified Brevibacterium TaxID=2614124 RepID=UPI001E3F1F71|nr:MULTISPECIES: hypothetical protein [unclassified Brevibacterium]MCD1284292.1 hypothetical protein [Brevibacterium sp. CCUG 69071]MDK8436098.1 hypothetical protein [Brevibacterium sp. H-BE7]
MNAETNTPKPTGESNEIEDESTTAMDSGSPDETPEQKLDRIASEHGVNIDGDVDAAKDEDTRASEERPDVRGGDSKSDDEDPEPPD